MARFTLLAFAALLALAATAASIPAWLDEAVTEYNSENADAPLRFVDIKDSYVWYMTPDPKGASGKEIRGSIYQLIVNEGYELADSEEMVTTGKPPTPTAPYKAKKCWTRSFVITIDELSNTTMAGAGTGQRSGVRQRMLTSMVCQDGASWWMGFRTLQ